MSVATRRVDCWMGLQSGGRVVTSISSWLLSALQFLVHRRPTTTALTTEQSVERLTKLHLEDGVEDWIDCRVDVAEPEEERVEAAWNTTRCTPAVDHVYDEEAEPCSAQDGHYDGGSDGSPSLKVLGVTHSSSPYNTRHARPINISTFLLCSYQIKIFTPIVAQRIACPFLCVSYRSIY